MTSVQDHIDEFMQDHIDEIVIRAARSRDHRAAAASFEAEAEECPLGQRSEYLIAAGEQYRLADDLPLAIDAFRRAVEAGGPCDVDPRAYLADALLGVGEEAAAFTLLDRLRRRRADDPELVLFVGESLEAHGHLKEAHNWLTAGVYGLRLDEPDARHALLAQARSRVRRSLGLPTDELDHIVGGESRPPVVRGAEDLPLGAGLALLVWPRAEFERLAERWPAVGAADGRDHEGHRRQVELTLRDLASEGVDCAVTLGRLDELDGFCSIHNLDGTDAAVRTRYSETVRGPERTVAWPPPPNVACWCSSGLRYKRCCRRLG